MVALATPAPEGSCTLPWMLLLNCAKATLLNRIALIAQTRRLGFNSPNIVPPPLALTRRAQTSKRLLRRPTIYILGVSTVKQFLGSFALGTFTLNETGQRRQGRRRSHFLDFGSPASAPALVLHNAGALPQGDKLVRRELLELFMGATGPEDVQIDRIKPTQAEVQAGIITRIETGLAQHGLGLRLATIVNHHPSPDRAAVRFHSLELHLDPVLLLLDVVAQK